MAGGEMNVRKGLISLCQAILLLTLPVAAAMAAEPFFSDGQTVWKIYLSPGAGLTEKHAAGELQGALKNISGADFEIIAADKAPGSNAVIIGDLSNADVKAQATALKLTAGEVEQIAVYNLGERLYLAGNQPRGALYAVYSFLQRDLGVRWLWPGPSGEFMPVKKSWTLPQLKYNHKPAIAYRGFHLCGDWRDIDNFKEWMGRNFINIHRHGVYFKADKEKSMGFYSMWSSHNARLPRELFDQHPEYFTEVDGKHYSRNICFSKPEVDRLVADGLLADIKKRPDMDILSIFPADDMTYCRCAECSKKDVSTAWFEFYNRLTDIIRKEYPRLKLATIAYQGYMDVPACKIRNTDFIEVATYPRCNVHPYGHPDCKSNDNMMKILHDWQATGISIGNYAYEYDIFTKNRRFVPFLSMIDDAVKTSRRLGHVTLIPEVGLSPKTGPEVYVSTVQNRLSTYLYAQLLWDPDRRMDDLLKDWCAVAFGPASAPMYDYYTSMDKAWGNMSIHRGILGNSISTVSYLLTEELQRKTSANFAAADKALAGIKVSQDETAGARWTAAVDMEKVFFRQWQELYQAQSGQPVINLPLLAGKEAFATTASSAQQLAAAEGNTWPAEVRAAWTKDALLVKWVCLDRSIKDLKSRAAGHDGKVTEDDSLELVLSAGTGGETWHFAVNAKGARQDFRISTVGVREDLWNPLWQASANIQADRWEGEMVIPFASLGIAPNANESWQATFRRNNGGRRDYAAGAFPASEAALLRFSSAARTDRALLWWSGAPERESRNDEVLKQDFLQTGWQFNLVTRGEELNALHDRSDVFWFRHPNGFNKVPADYWRNKLAPAVRNGALAVFVSYWNVPLDVYFDDPSLKTSIITSGKLPLAGRRTQYVAPGDWSLRPNNIQRIMKDMISPAYGFTPADPAAWTILATTAREEGDPFPYILARQYGKGMIILCGDSIPIRSAMLLDNFVTWFQEAVKATAAK